MSIVGPLTKPPTNLEELIASGWIDGASIKLVNDDGENGLFAMIEDGRIFCSCSTCISVRDPASEFVALGTLNPAPHLMAASSIFWKERILVAAGSMPASKKNLPTHFAAATAVLGLGGYERKTSPVGYICYKCKLPDLLLTRKLRDYLRTNLSLIFHQNFVSTMERSNERCCLDCKLLFQQFLR